MNTSTLAVPHTVTPTPTPSGATALSCSVCGHLGTHLLTEVASDEATWHQERHNRHSVVVRLPGNLWHQLRQAATVEGSTLEQWTQAALTRAVS